MNGERPKRGERVAERVRTELMELLLRGAVRDPAVADCYVSDVKVSDDLRNARVYIRMAKADVTEDETRRAIAGLNRARGYIRRELAPRLAMKYQPELRFFWDEGVDHANRIEELLSESRAESDRGDSWGERVGDALEVPGGTRGR